MGVIKEILKKNIRKSEIEEYLRNMLKDSFFGGVDIGFSPLGTRVTIYAMRPGRVIGLRGKTIKEISQVLEEKFGLENPQIAVAEIEIPELNPYIMASRIASAIAKGIRFRRVAFWALKRIMDAGARGVIIEISGKTTSARARTEKFVEGYIPKCGENAIKYLRKASVPIQLKTGVYGVKVIIYPPEAPLPDSYRIKTSIEKKEEIESEKE